ncbi:MAG: gas vesicle protein, partial [Nanoarchaeota archaeon]|nr:gas vesicle protein [Nanoarchaeota archaeon]
RPQKLEVFVEMDNINKIGIVELIDRILEKGAILNADLIVTVAEVPLLAANLRLALASVETMIKYGVMNDWLEATNIVENEKIKLKPQIVLNKNAQENETQY